MYLRSYWRSYTSDPKEIDKMSVDYMPKIVCAKFQPPSSILSDDSKCFQTKTLAMTDFWRFFGHGAGHRRFMKILTQNLNFSAQITLGNIPRTPYKGERKKYFPSKGVKKKMIFDAFSFVHLTPLGCRAHRKIFFGSKYS